MKYITSGDWLKIPADVALCPECGCELLADIFEWEVDSGRVTEGGFTIECEAEDFEDPDTCHRHWQSDWQPQIDAVFAWLNKDVRVRHKGVGEMKGEK